jgi:hypothetical protein
MATKWGFWVPNQMFVVAAHTFNATSASAMKIVSCERKECGKNYNGI